MSRTRLNVNGESHDLDGVATTRLLDVLRRELGLTGTKLGCEIGYCGACTVLVDDDAAHSCCVLAGSVEDRPITTIEGLSHDGLTALQESFLDAGAVQCGYCIPGIVMTAEALRREDVAVTDESVRAHLSGNICRCSGFASIVRAVVGARDDDTPAADADGDGR